MRRAIVAAGVVFLLALLARPAWHFNSGVQARRAAAEASRLIEKEDWSQAAKKAGEALAWRGSEPAAWDVTARLLSRTGQSEAALRWWKKIDQARALTISERREYAGGALQANELSLAKAQIDWLMAQKPAPFPADRVLAMELATQRGDSPSAMIDAEKVLGDARAGASEVLSALTIVILNTEPSSSSYASALDRLVSLARMEGGSVSLRSLELLARTPARPRLSDVGNPPLCIAPEADKWKLISRAELADRLDRHPLARPLDHLIAMDVREQQETSATDNYVTKAATSHKNDDDEELAAMSHWLYDHGQFERVLEILPSERAVRRRDLLIQRIDALDALGRYPELLAELSVENSVLDQTSQHLFLAIVRSRMGEAVASVNEWERALESAESSRQYFMIARFAEKNKALVIAEEAFARITMKEPDLRSAYLSRLRLAEATDQTAKAHEIASEIVRRWPEDVASRMHEIYLRLLLGASPDETRVAEKEARARVHSNPWDVSARMVWALAFLKEGRQVEALAAVSEFNPGEKLESPPLAVRAAALAANGWKEEERKESEKLQFMKLLPEERKLFASPEK